jgi:hypothetical protein
MLIKVMVLVLIAAFVGLFFVTGPSGEPIMKLEDLKPEIPDLMTSLGKPVKVYKWQNESGVWQFSNQPVDLATHRRDVAPVRTSGLSNIPDGLTTVSPEKITEIMGTIANLQETVDQRKEVLDKLVPKQN